MYFKYLKKPLTIAALSTTLMGGVGLPSVAFAQGTIVIDEGIIQALLLLLGLSISDAESTTEVTTDETNQRKTSNDGTINIQTTGSISTNNEPAVLVDTANALNIVAGNASGAQPGIVVNGTPTDASLTHPGAVGLTGEGGRVVVGAGSGIFLNTNANSVLTVELKSATTNTVGATVDNYGIIKSPSGISGVYVLDTVDPTIINRSTGTITANQFGIHIINTNGPVTNYNIVNEAGGTITHTRTTGADSSAIYFSGNNSGTITNQGSILGVAANSAAVNGFVGGQTLTLTNLSGGLIQGEGSGVRFGAGSANNVITISNSGTITGKNAPGIDISGVTKTSTIVNYLGGLVQGGTDAASSGITINNTYTGDISNAGTVTGTQAAIYLTPTSALTGNIANSGTLSVTDSFATNATAGGIWLGAGATMTGNIVNTGGISASGQEMVGIRLDGNLVGDVSNSGTVVADNRHALSVTNGVTGNIYNSGTLSQTNAAGGQAVRIVGGGGGITGLFNNSGVISSASTGVAAVTVEADLTKHFYNSGDIYSAFGTAIDFSGATNTNYFQSGGTITGNIEGHTGNFTATFTGGTVNGQLLLTAGDDIVNIQNTIFNGSIEANPGSTDTLNVTGPFINTSPINNFKVINIGDGATTFGWLTVAEGNTITMNAAGGALNIKTGSIIDLQGTFSEGAGSTPIDNDGILYINETGVLNIGSALVNDGQVLVTDTGTISVDSINNTVPGSGNGLYGFEMTDTTAFGKLTVGAGGGNITGDTIGFEISGDGFIQAGQTFTVINSAAALTGNGAVILEQPDSQTLSFMLSNIGANDVTVTAMRNPFQNVGLTENSVSVGTALDLLVDDPNLHPDLKNVIAQLDIQATKDGVTNGLESLTPDNNMGIVQVSQDIHTNTQDTIIGRLSTSREVFDIVKTIQSGDIPYYGFGAWGKVFASRISQKAIDQYDGYTATSTGVTFGVDRILNDNLVAGGALSYATADVDSRDRTGNEVDVNSVQLTAYGSYDFQNAWYVDMLASAALNRYKSKRIIDVGNFVRTARADYKAWQYSAKVQAGYAMAYEKYRITPVVGGHFAMLDIDSYTESTAGGANLAVDARSVAELVGTFGIRFSSLNEYVEALYVPELRILAHYDFIRDRQVTTSNFVGNGNVFFETRSFKPDPMTYNIGTALTAYGEKLTFSINYDLEFKKQFLGHYGFIKLRYEW